MANLSEKIRFKSKRFRSLYEVFSSFFFSKISLKCSFGANNAFSTKLLEKFRPVDWNFFGPPPKKMLRTFSSPKCSFGHTKCSSYNLVGKILGRGPKFFRSMSKIEKKFSFKKVFSSKCSSGHIECSYDNPSERKKYAKVLNMFAQCPQLMNTLILRKTKIFLRMFLWPTKRQFKKLWPKIFANSSKHFSPNAWKKTQFSLRNA